MQRATLSFVVLVQQGDEGGFLGPEPDGPLLPPLPADEAHEVPLLERAPESAARFVVYTGATPAEEALIKMREHEVAGGLRVHAEVRAALDAQRGRLRKEIEAAVPPYRFKPVEGEKPDAAAKRRAEEEAAHLNQELAWAQENAFVLDHVVRELHEVWDSFQRVARLDVLLREAPPAYLPFRSLAFADRARLWALFEAYEDAHARYLRGKARPSGG